MNKADREFEVCVCAAWKATTGEIIRGHRHADCMRTMLECGLIPAKTEDAQGFMTTRNRFVWRALGAKLQRLAGVKSVRTGELINGFLLSEDLY